MFYFQKKYTSQIHSSETMFSEYFPKQCCRLRGEYQRKVHMREKDKMPVIQYCKKIKNGWMDGRMGGRTDISYS